jgi:hypothetical protein
MCAVLFGGSPIVAQGICMSFSRFQDREHQQAGTFSASIAVPGMVTLSCRWRFRQQYDTEIEAALGYDQAIRRLAPREAEGFCNFPPTYSPGNMTPDMSGGVMLPISGAPMDMPRQAMWDAEDVHVRLCLPSRSFSRVPLVIPTIAIFVLICSIVCHCSSCCWLIAEGVACLLINFSVWHCDAAHVSRALSVNSTVLPKRLKWMLGRYTILQCLARQEFGSFMLRS